ncbi:hypothetical protein D3C76_805520 [compost metagenome]
MVLGFLGDDAQPLAEHLDLGDLQVFGQQPERFHQVERVLVVDEITDPKRHGDHQPATLLEQVVGLFHEQLRANQVLEDFADDNGVWLDFKLVQQEEVGVDVSDVLLNVGGLGRQVALGLFNGLGAGVHTRDLAALARQQQGNDPLRAADIEDLAPFDLGADPVDAGLCLPHELLPKLAVIGLHHTVTHIGQR